MTPLQINCPADGCDWGKVVGGSSNDTDLMRSAAEVVGDEYVTHFQLEHVPNPVIVHA